MVDAAVGSRAILGRGIEKSPGIRQGFYKFLNFISADLGRNSKENESQAITGFGGRDRSTPGPIDHANKFKYDLTTFRFLYELVVEYGAPASITDLEGGGTGPWLVKIRPGSASPAYRGAHFYVHEGGSYSGVFQYGRRVDGVSLGSTANKRVEVDVDYTEPTGDSISGMPVANGANTGTLVVRQVASRGRRTKDADFLAGKSVYVKVVSISGTTSAVVKAKVDIPAFAGAGTYGANTFTIFRPDSSGHDGFSIVKDSTSGLLLGNFGENFEPFEVTLGDQSMALLAVDDEYEFPATLLAGSHADLAKTVVAEHRLSEFHHIISATTDDAETQDIRIDSGSLKLMRPYKPYYTNGRKLPSSIDPTGDIQATFTLKKRLVDRFFRDLQDRSGRLSIEHIFKFGNPLVGTTFEGIHIFTPQVAVVNAKSGDIPNKNTLDENLTLEAEQPDADPTAPDPILDATDVFDEDATFPFQVNVITPIDPNFLL